MTYMQGFLLAVPTANKEAYREMAEMAVAIFKEYGAIRCFEGWGNDVPEGKVNSFHTATMRKEDETVVFSFIEWPDKETCDKGSKAAMEDPRMVMPADGLPFDGMRMMWGGFDPLVDK